MEYKDPGRYIPIIYLLYSWEPRFGVPSRVPLQSAFGQEELERARPIIRVVNQMERKTDNEIRF